MNMHGIYFHSFKKKTQWKGILFEVKNAEEHPSQEWNNVASSLTWARSSRWTGGVTVVWHNDIKQPMWVKGLFTSPSHPRHKEGETKREREKIGRQACPCEGLGKAKKWRERMRPTRGRGADREKLAGKWVPMWKRRRVQKSKNEDHRVSETPIKLEQKKPFHHQIQH